MSKKEKKGDILFFSFFVPYLVKQSTENMNSKKDGSIHRGKIEKVQFARQEMEVSLASKKYDAIRIDRHIWGK